MQTNPTDTPVEAAPQTVQSTPQTAPQFVTLGTSVALCIVTAAVTLMAVFFGPGIAAKFGVQVSSTAESSSKVVYLDFDRLLAAGIKRAMEGDRAAVDDVKKDADKFQTDITAVIQKYAEAGYMVINYKALINASRDQDITPDVMKKLGLK